MIRFLAAAGYFIGTLFVSGFTLGPAVLILHILGLRRASEDLRAAIMRVWGRYAVLMAGGQVRVIGRENLPNSNQICFICNHQDYSDIVLLLGWIGRPIGFLGKRELGMVPVMSSWMRLSHSLFLDRSSLRQGVQMIHRAASNIRKGRPLVIFPEGTRNFGGPLGDFKAGSFKAAKLAGGWIVPVTLDGSWRFMQIPRRVLPGRLRIVIHQAIDASALDVQGWKELPGRVREAIAGSILLTPEREGFKPRASKHRIAVG